MEYILSLAPDPVSQRRFSQVTNSKTDHDESMTDMTCEEGEFTGLVILRIMKYNIFIDHNGLGLHSSGSVSK